MRPSVVTTMDIKQTESTSRFSNKFDPVLSRQTEVDGCELRRMDNSNAIERKQITCVEVMNKKNDWYLTFIRFKIV